MFVLMLLKDTFRIPPNQLTPLIKNSILDHINAKYANKVRRESAQRQSKNSQPPPHSAHFPCLLAASTATALQVLASQGLCICAQGLDTVGPPLIYGGDGAAHIRVAFRLIVFRPFASEVIVGRVKACDATGLLVSLDFFDHIFVPAHELQYPSHL